MVVVGQKTDAIMSHNSSKKNKEWLLKEVLTLTPVEKAEIVDQLLKSLDVPDDDLDSLWQKEAEDRINAYDRGQLPSVSVEEAISKYKK